MRYPVCCGLWSVWLYRIFPHYLVNGTIFGGGDVEILFGHKLCVLNSLQLYSAVFLILIRIVIHVLRSTCNVPVILSNSTQT